MVYQLGMLSTFRGTHGSGILQVNMPSDRDKKKGHKTDFTVWKKPYPFWSFVESEKFKQKKDNRKTFLNDVFADVIAGHVRFATRGELNVENTHPFDMKNLVGMHNGTLNAWKYNDKVKTDSELMFAEMNKEGVLPVLKTLTDADAYAIVVYDKVLDKLIFARNNQRTLYFCSNERRSVMYWASEQWMLEVVFERNKEKMKGGVFYFSPHKMYSLNPDDVTHNYDPDKESFFDSVKYEPNKTRHFADWGDWMSEYRGVHGPHKTNIHVPLLEHNNSNNNRSGTSPKIPITKCVSCSRDMRLIDRYQGIQISGDTYSCKECEEELTKLDQENEVKVG